MPSSVAPVPVRDTAPCTGGHARLIAATGRSLTAVSAAPCAIEQTSSIRARILPCADKLLISGLLIHPVSCTRGRPAPSCIVRRGTQT